MPEASIWIFFGQCFYSSRILYCVFGHIHTLSSMLPVTILSACLHFLSNFQVFFVSFYLSWVQFVMPRCPGMGLTCEVTALKTSDTPSPSGPQMPFETLVLASVCLLVSAVTMLVSSRVQLPFYVGKTKAVSLISSTVCLLDFLTPICEDPEPRVTVSVRCGMHTWILALGWARRLEVQASWTGL